MYVERSAASSDPQFQSKDGEPDGGEPYMPLSPRELARSDEDEDAGVDGGRSKVRGDGKAQFEDDGAWASPPVEPDETPPTTDRTDTAADRSAGRHGLKQRPPLVVTFHVHDGSVRAVDFTGRESPLGLDFGKGSPAPVHSVKPGGHADQLGVQPGWVLLAINGQELGGMPFRQAMHTLAAAAARSQGLPEPTDGAVLSGPQTPPPSAPMPTPGAASGRPDLSWSGGGGSLVITFKLPDGVLKDVDFCGRRPPLGIDFDRHSAIMVKKVKPGGHAEELGIEPGWEVACINGASVEGRSAIEVFQMMKAAVLPTCKAQML